MFYYLYYECFPRTLKNIHIYSNCIHPYLKTDSHPLFVRKRPKDSSGYLKITSHASGTHTVMAMLISTIQEPSILTVSKLNNVHNCNKRSNKFQCYIVFNGTFHSKSSKNIFQVKYCLSLVTSLPS